MEKTKFWTVCSSNSIILDKDQLVTLERYENELKYWNEKVNMVSRQDIDNLRERHILHSLALLKYIDIQPKAKCLDIGTGGGLPGIPVKIARPDLHMYLIDSIVKKVKMTDMFAKHTQLQNIHVLCERAEKLHYDNEYVKKFDLVIARAVAPAVKIIRWCKEIVKDDAQFALLKGGDLTTEINNVRNEYPKSKIQEISINILGVPWFKDEGKKILKISL